MRTQEQGQDLTTTVKSGSSISKRVSIINDTLLSHLILEESHALPSLVAGQECICASFGSDVSVNWFVPRSHLALCTTRYDNRRVGRTQLTHATCTYF
jgi:hypothetical protein